MHSVPIRFDRSWWPAFKARVHADGPWNSWELFQLAVEAERHVCVPNFDDLLCLKQLNAFAPLPHQVETARTVLNELHGRAILADEVGLGKTIEAGLILKEYVLRGLVKNALILVPASLVSQWTRELNEKFGIPAVAHKKEWMWEKCDILVASIDTAKREPHRSHVLNRDYDIIVIDEAHKLKNRRTRNFQFANELRKKFCLLLTATPIQNDLQELYNLVTLLKPGQLGGEQSFQSQYVVSKRQPKNEALLKEEIRKVMIRNERKDSPLDFKQRHVHTVTLDLTPEERALYDGITDFVRERYQKNRGLAGSFLSLVNLQREACSSREATFLTLFKMFKKEIQGRQQLPDDVAHVIHLLKQVKEQAKAREVLKLVDKIGDEKVIVFTGYRATQDMLRRVLQKHGITSVPYRGNFNRNKKDWMRQLFQQRAQVMVATEAGGEGINLQFCHNIINYDMPWNPMRVEQRIGRVHRLGQEHDVTIYNLCTRNTIEEYIIRLLHEKINLFQLVIGELDKILAHVHLKERTLENNIMKIVLESRDDEEVKQRLSHLGDTLSDAKHHTSQKADLLKDVLNP
ncbi:DEAD/DEAH box helicase [Novibacillus thermophilus]|jgi:SNF2 family DNA or RNA helicase|uniref:ATP-dependent helicase n=1 Tax=Novibacillus thermophilus TaxID=1471761 RepID=A0A1U9K933_9BACL|nr:SNF2-related protein [Novibacillus thermophilus]AQS56544.1 ATP-dependent helicase [Novibacillus thermophilus]